MAMPNRRCVLMVLVAVVVSWIPFCTGQEAITPAARAKPFIEKGTALAGQGDAQGAIMNFSQAIEIDPKNPTPHAARGNARVSIGELEEAIADFSRAIELDPVRRVPYINRGVAKVDKGDLAGAIADYTKVIEMEPKNITAYRNRGCANQQKGDIEGARKDYQQAIQLATDEGAYQRFYLFLLGLSQKPVLPGADFKALVGTWKPGWKKNLGLFLGGDIDEASLLELASVGIPKVVREQKCEAYYFAGAVRQAKGDVAGAKSLFERCVMTQLHTFPEFQLARAELVKIDKGTAQKQ